MTTDEIDDTRHMVSETPPRAYARAFFTDSNDSDAWVSLSLVGDRVMVEAGYGERWNSSRCLHHSEAHKLADWIKVNIPEPPPAPPEWRISRDATCSLLEVHIDKASKHWPLMAYVRPGGEIVYPGRIPDGVTPELHKEMICALLDAHYELHKGES